MNDCVTVPRESLTRVLELAENVQNMTLCCEFCSAAGKKHDLTTPLIHEADCPAVPLLARLSIQEGEQA